MVGSCTHREQLSVVSILSQKGKTMNAIQHHAAALLDRVARCNEVTTLAKLRYQVELVPDFNLMNSPCPGKRS